MQDWASYALSDFLMFSPASYYRRYELANADLWPGQLLLAAAAITLLWALRRPGPRSGQWAALLLAAVWAMVAGLFLHRHYAQINLAADGFALVFLLQALLLLACGLSPTWRQRVLAARPVSTRHPGMLLFVYALLVHPLFGLLADRPWQGVELFGIAPDATALATLGILLTGSLAANWPLLIVPLTWCAISALTYLAMGHVHGIAPLVLAIAALVATLFRNPTRADNATR
ncbi:MAG: DUF6064 family protein [Gammaproteobacteria bacterium]|nr:DUF6064 family protein [Gammaproteobacteria bacterium]